jgi:glycopeptide antibiotics resistance protein
LNGTDRFNTDIILENLLGNILIFLTLGVFLPLLFKKYRSLAKMLLYSVSLSFVIEAVQILGRIGQFDIDDILLNTFGCLLGHLAAMIFVVARTLLRRETA